MARTNVGADPAGSSPGPKPIETGGPSRPSGVAPDPAAPGHATVVNEFERGYQGPLYGYKGAAMFGLVCSMPFVSRVAGASPWESIAPAIPAFAIGSAWMLGVMRLIHWLGTKPSWPPRLKRNLVVAAVLGLPVSAFVVSQIAARI